MQTNTNPKAMLKVISTIHIAMLFGMLAFLIFVYLQEEGVSTQISPTDIFVYLVPVVALGGYFLANYLFRKLIMKAKSELDLPKKLGVFQRASIVKYACVEVPILLAIFAFMEERHMLYLSIAVVLMLYFYAQRPHKTKVFKLLELRKKEIDQLQ